MKDKLTNDKTLFAFFLCASSWMVALTFMWLSVLPVENRHSGPWWSLLCFLSASIITLFDISLLNTHNTGLEGGGGGKKSHNHPAELHYAISDRCSILENKKNCM